MRLPGLLERFAGATSRATVQTCSSAALCLSFRPSANMPHETTRLVRCWHCAGDKLDVLRDTYAAALVCGSRNITVLVDQCETRMHPPTTAWCNCCDKVRIMVGGGMSVLSQLSTEQETL